MKDAKVSLFIVSTGEETDGAVSPREPAEADEERAREESARRRKLTKRPATRRAPMLDKTYIPSLSHARFKMSAPQMRKEIQEVRCRPDVEMAGLGSARTNLSLSLQIATLLQKAKTAYEDNPELENGMINELQSKIDVCMELGGNYDSPPTEPTTDDFNKSYYEVLNRDKIQLWQEIRAWEKSIDKKEKEAAEMNAERRRKGKKKKNIKIEKKRHWSGACSGDGLNVILFLL